jgi:sulfotransferase
MMSFEKQYYFIAGLPRSGSTLLSTILSQNPQIHSSITTPVLPLFRSVYDVLGNDDEYSTLVSDKSKERLLKGVFDNYYSDTNKSIVFDTNRLWPNTYYAVKKLFPYTKIILTVRDIPWIMDSFEQARNKNPLNLSSVFPKEHDYNVYTRADSLMRENGIIYNAYFATKTLCYSALSSDILLVDYDELAKDPQKIMQQIYSFTNIRHYEHDFSNVGNSFNEYDVKLGFPNLHTTKPKVEYTPRRSVLPPEIWDKYTGMEFWKPNQ